MKLKPVFLAVLTVLALLIPAASASANVSYSEARSLTVKVAKNVAFKNDAGWGFGGCVRSSNIKLFCKANMYGWKNTTRNCRFVLRIFQKWNDDPYIHSRYWSTNCPR